MSVEHVRRRLIAGNWKMYKTRAEAEQFAREMRELFGVSGSAAADSADSAEAGRPGSGVAAARPEAVHAGIGVSAVDAVICAPFTALPGLADLLAPSGVSVGAQNVHQSAEGAFTGEISAAMLRELGCAYTIVGHSERRQYFAESDAAVAQKTVVLLDAGIAPIVCVGETLQDREAGRTEAVVRAQVAAVVAAVRERAAGSAAAESVSGGTLEASAMVLAYEPIWAIGTGRSSSAQDAQQVAGWIRGWLAAGLGSDVAGAIRILYGGSVKPDNIAEFVAAPDVDGALVGGASLVASSYAALVRRSGG